jgi:hypothetical protein
LNPLVVGVALQIDRARKQIKMVGLALAALVLLVLLITLRGPEQPGRVQMVEVAL